MIRKEELRIGNFVKAPFLDGAIATIDGILPDRKGIVVNGIITRENLEPIPLTPEILEACGFDSDYDGNYRFQIERWVFIWLSEYEIFNIGRGAQLAEYTRIEKLHQLQNAVHALTGFELTINLEKVKV